MKKLNDTSRRVTYYRNAVKRSLNNSSVMTVMINDSDFGITFKMVDKENANKQAAFHKTEKGVVRVTAIRLSKESFKALILNGIEMLTSDEFPTTNKNNPS